ncbi:MAG: ABC transporter substrate-binding protein [Anaerovoracaceae bacterium]
MNKAMKKTIAILLILVMVLAMAGCGSDDSKVSEGGEKILKIAVDYEMDSLDPARALDDVSSLVMYMIYEPLIRYADGEVYPGVAESWEVNEENTEYVFNLRQDATFSNGDPVTANDFEYAILRALDPEKAYGYKPDEIIKNGKKYCEGECDASEVGVEVIDDYTLKITCENPTFPIEFSDSYFFPLHEETVEAMGEEYGAEAAKVLGNGPFTLTEWTHESKVVAEKNENYWNKDEVKLTAIEGYINAYGTTATDMMTVGELDAANTIYTRSEVDGLKEQGFTEMNRNSGWQFLHISYKGSSEETVKWLKNTNFRLALTYALDRTNLRDAVYRSDNVATRFALPGEAGTGDKLYVEEYPYEPWGATADTEKAKEYMELAMEEMNVSSVDEIPTFVMLTLDSEGNMDALNAMADMWLKNLGIKCTIDAQPIATMLDKADAGDYDFWKGGHDNTGAVDLLKYAKQYVSGYFPGYYYEDEAYDALYRKAVSATTWEERKDACFELEQYFCEHAIDIIITNSMDVLVLSDKVTNVKFGSQTIEYAFADIVK